MNGTNLHAEIVHGPNFVSIDNCAMYVTRFIFFKSVSTPNGFENEVVCHLENVLLSVDAEVNARMRIDLTGTRPYCHLMLYRELVWEYSSHVCEASWRLPLAKISMDMAAKVGFCGSFETTFHLNLLSHELKFMKREKKPFVLVESTGQNAVEQDVMSSARSKLRSLCPCTPGCIQRQLLDRQCGCI